ncbi:PTS sugar transporter subunit IIA, partial [Enterococcus cecorum]|uniref:PTS sugar transporter subunit IIA n=1 Tax=Enterococcus cecorum TaxID=44008 RepID=UPI001FACBB7D
YGIYFSEDEIGYIALHLAGAIERNESFQNTRLRCIIVCGSGLTMSKIIQIKLEKKYGDLITVVKKYSYLELQQANLSGIDLIITTIPIKHDTIPVTVIDMNHLDKEIERLKETINYSLPNSNRIFQLFSSDQFHVINDEQLTKEQLLRQMCQRLVDNGAVPEQFFESVWEREQIESTNINQNIALPHPMQLISNKSSVSVAIIPNGIEWGNDSVVHFIFLLSIQKKEYKNFLFYTSNPANEG